MAVDDASRWVIRCDDFYYMTYTTATNITLLRSAALTDWNNAESKLLFQPPEDTEYSTSLWAPELHWLQGKWYVIFTADPNYDSPPPETDMLCDWGCPAVNHRMFVLEGVGSDPWDATFDFKAQLDTWDSFAIDGTYFAHRTGLYHVYSCWYRPYDGWPANLCIAKMDNPWTVASNFSERQIISVPDQAWEKTPYGRTFNDRLSSNEGPQQLTNPLTNQTFIIYSAGRSDNRNYCLGQLELVGNDPMNPQDWRKHDGCVFYQDARAQAYGVGHASFVPSPDGSEDWIVYHGMREPVAGWGARTIRAQPFAWNPVHGSPVFPRPGYGPYAVPAGQA